MNPKIKKTSFGIYVMVDDTHLSRWVEQDRRLDHARHYLEKFRQYLKPGSTVIDCGTSIGDHTVTYASLVGPNGKVLGFEANPDVAECCQLNLQPYPWAKIFNVGLSDHFGACGIEINPNVGASHLTVGHGNNIFVAPLDDYFGLMNRCDFIKVDIEGFEPRMLKGAEVTIMRFKPAILMEINSGALAVQGFTQDHVFEILSQYGYKWTVADGVAGSPQYDILALPAK